MQPFDDTSSGGAAPKEPVYDKHGNCLGFIGHAPIYDLHGKVLGYMEPRRSGLVSEDLHHGGKGLHRNYLQDFSSQHFRGSRHLEAEGVGKFRKPFGLPSSLLFDADPYGLGPVANRSTPRQTAAYLDALHNGDMLPAHGGVHSHDVILDPYDRRGYHFDVNHNNLSHFGLQGGNVPYGRRRQHGLHGESLY
jgi:hypothetical protein